MQQQKRVILLDHIKSDHIEQAIIILRDNIPSRHTSIVAEAQEIVDDYAKSVYHGRAAKKITVKNEGAAAVLWIALSAGVCLAALIFWFLSAF